VLVLELDSTAEVAAEDWGTEDSEMVAASVVSVAAPPVTVIVLRTDSLSVCSVSEDEEELPASTTLGLDAASLLAGGAG
jgi:hypothetical protein